MRSAKKKSYFKRRKFKRLSTRKLSVRDLSVLDFLWTWKVASTPIIAEMAYRDVSAWWAYKALRQLQNEKLIQVLPRGKNLDLELWALTEPGFEVVLMDRDDIEFYRYRPHAPAHDYYATCLQLGEVWLANSSKQFITEQMLSSLAHSNFSKIKLNYGHIPDGLTLFEGSLKDTYVGYEVDLNLKDHSRYAATFSFYNANYDVCMIVWLVRNAWIANQILAMMDRETELLEKVCFVLLDDFKKNVWGAQGVYGKYKGHTLSKLHANLLQNLGKPAPNTLQKDLREVFFSKYKSPQKAKGYVKPVFDKNL